VWRDDISYKHDITTFPGIFFQFAACQNIIFLHVNVDVVFVNNLYDHDALRQNSTKTCDVSPYMI